MRGSDATLYTGLLEAIDGNNGNLQGVVIGPHSCDHLHRGPYCSNAILEFMGTSLEEDQIGT